MSKENTSETIMIQVDNTTPKAENVEVMSTPTNQEISLAISDANTVAVDKEIASGTSFETKSQQEGKKFSGTLSYEDILSQTQELSSVQVSNIDYLAEEMEMRREKIEALDEHLKDLNAQPLSSVDSYSNYNLVLNKSIWNYNEVEQRNSKLQLIDLALQTHIYLYDGVIIPIDEIKATINNFVEIVRTNVVQGYPVILNSSLILDALRFDKGKLIPVAIANPKLIPPIGVIEWQSIVPNESKNHLIIETFIKLLDSALTNGHECEFYPGTILVKNASGITSLYISEAAALKFSQVSSVKSKK